MKVPSESGTPSLVPVKREEPVLTERRKFGSWASTVNWVPS